MVACSHPRSEVVTDMNVICSRRALLAAICARRAALTFAAPGAATVGTGSARGTGAPIVTIDSGSALAVVQRRLEGAVARVATARARLELRLHPSLLVLGHRMMCIPRRVLPRLAGTA